MTNRTNDCIDCRHYKKDADDKVYCNFYNTLVSKCKIQYCGIFSPRDIYIVDGVEMNAKEYIRHLEDENERLQQKIESIDPFNESEIIVSLLEEMALNDCQLYKYGYWKITDCNELEITKGKCFKNIIEALQYAKSKGWIK